MESTNQTPIISVGESLKLQLFVHDPSGVDRISMRFTTTEKDKVKSIYKEVDAGGDVEASPIIEIPIDEGVPSGVYRCEYVLLTDMQGNTTVIANPDIRFQVENDSEEREGPQLSDWKFVTA